MARALDHLVLPCRDLAAASVLYDSLGFIVGRRNRHDWGTENHIVQFDGAFLELIAAAPDQAPPVQADDAFPFAGFLAGLAGSTRPSGMIVLRAEDASADAVAFEAIGIGEGRRLDFSRTGAGPDGGTRTVSFSLAFATASSMPDIGFFTCRQHTPQFFWNAAAQRHPNGVSGVAAVVIAARTPVDHAAFLAHFADQGPLPIAGGYAIDVGNSRIEVIDEVTAALDYGTARDDDRPARVAAIRFAGGQTGRRRVALEDGSVLLFA